MAPSPTGLQSSVISVGHVTGTNVLLAFENNPQGVALAKPQGGALVRQISSQATRRVLSLQLLFMH